MKNYQKMTTSQLQWMARSLPEQSPQAIAASGELARRTLKPKNRKKRSSQRRASRHPSKIWPDYAGYSELERGLSSVLRRNAEL